MAAAIALTYVWYYRPDWFPQTPEHYAGLIVDVSGANSAEDIAMVSLAFGFAVLFSLLGASVFICARIYRRWRAQ